MSLPEACTFAEFAAIAGVKKSYVSALRKAQRLVLTEDGRAVRPRESLALIEATRSPAHAGVVERHAAARGEPTSLAAGAGEAAGSGVGAADDDDSIPPSSPHSERRAKALADKAETDAKVADRDYRLSMRELLEAPEVEQAAGSAVTVFRQAMEQLRDTLSPQLAATADESRVRALLGEAIEHSLEELARAFGALSRGAGA